MLSIVFHLSLTLGILWYQRRAAYRLRPWALSLIWYGVSSMLVFIESFVATGRAASGILLQGLFVALLHVPAMFFALRWAEKNRKGLMRPMFVFLMFAVISTLVAALVLARAEHVRGLPSGA